MRGAVVIRPRLPGRRSGGWLVAAGAIGLVAAVMTVRAAGPEPLAARIVVAREPLPAGLLLDAETTAASLRTMPVPEGLPLRGTFSDPAEAVGRRVAAPVGPGELLSEAALGGAPGSGPAPLAVGERAVAVPLSAAGGSAAGLSAGARVDVVASSGEGLTGTTALVVADAEVLAVAVSPPQAGFEGSVGEALLRVSSRQALRITAALNFSREVRLLARPADELGPPDGPRVVAAP